MALSIEDLANREDPLLQRFIEENPAIHASVIKRAVDTCRSGGVLDNVELKLDIPLTGGEQYEFECLERCRDYSNGHVMYVRRTEQDSFIPYIQLTLKNPNDLIGLSREANVKEVREAGTHDKHNSFHILELPQGDYNERFDAFLDKRKKIGNHLEYGSPTLRERVYGGVRSILANFG